MSLSIRNMNHAIGERDLGTMKRFQLPLPPSDHPYHEAQRISAEFSKKYNDARYGRINSDPVVQEAYNAWYAKNKVANALLDEWYDGLRSTLTLVREFYGEQYYKKWRDALPEGEAMLPMFDQIVEEIRQEVERINIKNGGGRVVSIPNSVARKS